MPHGGRQHQLRRRRLAEGVHDGAAQDFVHEPLIEEPHFGLRRVHVDVHAIGRELDEEVDLGAAFLDRRDAVGLLNGVRNRAVPHHPAIDEDVLRSARRPLIGERGDVAVHADAGCVLRDRHEIRAVAVDLEKTLLRRARGRRLEQHAIGASQRHPDLRIPERQLRHEPRNLGRFGGVGFQELPPGRQIEKQIRDFDERALGRSDLADVGPAPALDPDLGARERAARARPQAEPRDGRNRRQRLAAKPERAYRRQIRRVPDLARRVPLDSQLRVFTIHPDAVVFDRDEPFAAERDRDGDASRAGIHRVFDELLDHRRGALDHLPGGDLVGERGGQALDAAHNHSRRRNIHNMVPEITAMIPVIHQNCVPSPPGRCGSCDVHPVHPRQHRERHEDRRDHRQDLHDLIQPVRGVGEVRVEEPGHAILQEDRFVGQPHEVIVDVAELVAQRIGDLRKLPAGEARHGVALRQRHAPERRDFCLELQNVPQRVPLRPLEHRPLERFDPLLEPIDLRRVVVDHPVHDAMQQVARPFGQDVLVPRAHLELRLDRPRRRMVDRDQEIPAQEEVDVVRDNPLLPPGRLDAVQDQIQKVVVGLDLRVVHFGHRVFDGQLVKVEHLEQQPPLDVARSEHVDPERSRARQARATRGPPPRPRA